MKRLRKLFCKHKYKLIGYNYLALSDEYVCENCGKKKYISNSDLTFLGSFRIYLPNNPRND